MLESFASKSNARRASAPSWLLPCVVVATALFCLPVVAHATAVNFTLNSTTSTLDLTATGSALNLPFTVTEQSPGSKANTVSTVSGNLLQTNLYPTTFQFPTGNNDGAVAIQKGGIFNLPVNLRPGIGGVGAAAPGNYGVTLAYALDTPIALPALPLGSFGTISPGKITGLQMDVAFRDLLLDVNGITSRTGLTKSAFDPQDLSIGFAGGSADIGVGGILDIAGITGLGSFFDSLARPVIIGLLQGLVPSTPGFTVSFTNGTKATEIVIGTGIGQDLTALGSLPNLATTPGTIVQSGTQWKLAVPVEINPAAAIPPALTSLLGLSLNLNLKGTLNGTAPYVAVVPEPGSVALFGIGLVSLALVTVNRYRGKKS